LRASRDREHDRQRFMAAVQGIDLDKHAVNNSEDRVEAARRRVAAMASGKSKEEAEMDEFDLEYEVEE
jgi:hypothetical protein